LAQLFWVGIGGAVGAILRYVLSGHVQGQIGGTNFPYGTLAVNVIGCLLIGLLTRVVSPPERFANESLLFLFVGVFGAFTTFSTFGKETVDLFQAGRVYAGLANVGMHIVLGLAAVGAGYGLGRFLQR
jgi:CrcB protein